MATPISVPLAPGRCPACRCGQACVVLAARRQHGFPLGGGRRQLLQAQAARRARRADTIKRRLFSQIAQGE